MKKIKGIQINKKPNYNLQHKIMKELSAAIIENYGHLKEIEVLSAKQIYRKNSNKNNNFNIKRN